MFRSLSLQSPTRRLRSPMMIGAATLVVLCLSCLPQICRAQSVLEDPALRDYRAIDLGVFETPAAPAKPPSPPSALSEPPAEVRKTAPLPDAPAAPRVPELPRTLRRAEPVEYVEDIPLCAVIDLDSDTLDADLVSAVTTQVWNETRRAGHARLLRLADSRHILTSYNLTPSDPYRPPPTRRDMARALQADYLILGNVNNFEGMFALDLQLYSAGSNHVIRSANALSSTGFKDLLKEIPALVALLLEMVPLKAAPGMEAAAPAVTPTRTSREKLLENEIVALRLENERLQERLEALEIAVARRAPDEPAAPRTAPPQQGAETPAAARPLPPLQPVRHGNKIPLAPKTILDESEAFSLEPEIPADLTFEASPRPETPGMSQPDPGRIRPPDLKRESAPVPTPAPTAPPAPAATSVQDKEKAREFYRASLEFPTDSREGIEPLEKALDLDPGNVEYQRALVERLYRAGLFAECARRGKAFVNRGTMDAYLNIYIGAAFTELADYKEALEATDRVLKIEPNNGYALYNRALNLYKLSDREAAPAFRAFLERFGDDPAFAKYADSARACLKILEPLGQ